MGKQNVMYLYHGILFSNEKNKVWIHTWKNLKIDMLSERSQAHVTAYYMIPFIRNIQKDKLLIKRSFFSEGLEVE